MTTALVPPDQLFFAVLDRPVSSRARARREELLYEFEATLPVPITSIHAVFEPLKDGRVLAVGIDRGRAESLGRSGVAARPDAWPDCLAEAGELPAPTRINLLTGPCLPPSVLAARQRTVRHALIVAAGLSLILAAGLFRRAEQERRAADFWQDRAAATYQEALGADSSSSQPHAARMTSELRRLRATRVADPAPLQATPADGVLTALLAAWPDGLPVRTERLAVSERTVDVALRVEDLPSAQRFITAIGEARGLSPGPTKTDRDGDEVRLSMTLDRKDAP